ncbi:MAG: hypothetical protein KBE65_10355 [Phycisphaerae bacterium]|nr:hypothetical protein [Phycisphaerae bacterium]
MYAVRRFRGIAAVGLLLTIVCSAQAKYSGGTGEPNDPYQIATAADLIALGETPDDYDKHFILTADIDLDPNLPGRKVFDRAVIAPDTDPSTEWSFEGKAFTGSFDGHNHTILHLTITGKDYLGLFGQLGSWDIRSAEVENLELVDVTTTGTGTYIGGLVGQNHGSIAASCSTGSVSGDSSVGGLVGYNGGRIVACYSSGSVIGNKQTGGLVGENDEGDVAQCYSRATVVGSEEVGGLVGVNNVNCGATVHSCRAGNIAQSYSAGSVIRLTGDYYYCSFGGLVGQGCDNVTQCFWDAETSGLTTSNGGTGKTTAEMQKGSTFLIWATCGNEGIWTIDEGNDYPRLWWEERPGEPIRLAPLSDVLPGTGTEDDPFLIYTADQLETIGLFPCEWDKHFKLMSDIDLDPNLPGRKVFHKAVIAHDFSDNCGESFCGIPFTGVFDGNGYTISHLTITGAGYLGMFGQLASAAEVCNLGLEGVEVNGTGSCVGGLAGTNGASPFWGPTAGSSVINCYSTGTVRGSGHVGGLIGANGGSITTSYTAAGVIRGTYVGGLVGFNSGSIASSYSAGVVSGNEAVGGLVGENYGWIGESYSNGSVSGNEEVGGLVGYNGGSIVASYSTGSVSGTEGVGGLVGVNSSYDASITASYSSGLVRGTEDVGGLVGRNYAGDETIAITSSFWDMETSGQATSAGGMGKTTAEMCIAGTFLALGACGPFWTIDEGRDYPRLAWENVPGEIIAGPTYAGGAGTPETPYLISTAHDLNLIGEYSCHWDKHFRLIADIDLSGEPQTDSVIPSFSGAVDGNGHTVSGLRIAGGGYLGLFGRLESGANVKSLAVIDTSIAGSGDCIGGVAGVNSGGILSDCYVSGAVSGHSQVGGLVGFNSSGGAVADCSSTCAASGHSIVGGLIGRNDGTITACSSTGSASGIYSIGGLVGNNSGGSIAGSQSTGSVSGIGDQVGGLVGYNSRGSIAASYATGEVNGNWYVGGLVGYSQDSALTGCYSSAFVHGKNVAGGLVGRGGLDTVTACFWDIQTSGQGTSAGGTGKMTAKMQTAETFLEAGWDFVGETENGTEDIWWILEGKDYPRLWWELGDEASP